MVPFFVLGANGSTMQAIEKLLKQTHALYGFATYKGRRVSSRTAYKADSIVPAPPPKALIVFVGCIVLGVELAVRIIYESPDYFNDLQCDFLYKSLIGRVFLMLVLYSVPSNVPSCTEGPLDTEVSFIQEEGKCKVLIVAKRGILYGGVLPSLEVQEDRGWFDLHAVIPVPSKVIKAAIVENNKIRRK